MATRRRRHRPRVGTDDFFHAAVLKFVEGPGDDSDKGNAFPPDDNPPPPPPPEEIPAPATLVFAALGCGLGLIRYTRKGKPAAQAQA